MMAPRARTHRPAALVPIALAWAALVLGSPPVLAHEVLHSVARAGAVAITLSYADESAFAFEGYEVFYGEETIPFQVGRTDQRGRILFAPDRAGRWRVRAFSEDGHGAEFTMETDAQGGVEAAGGSALERYGRIVAGLAVLFGLFGLLQLFYRKRRSTQ
jgi:nickel transport protein